MKYQDKNLFYLQKHLATTIDLFNFIESETDVILKWKNNDEAKCHCPMPDHKDNNASFHLKRESDGTVIFHCLGGETGVITWDGIKKIKDIAGTTQKILTTGGHWVDAPFFYFGKQNVVKLTLSRNRQIKTIITTPSHRWFIDRDWNKIKKIKISKEKKTYELKIGEVLHSTFARKPQGIKTISPQGISHGIVYGDGTMSSNINESLVNLWGNKDKQLLKWFPLNRVSKIICPNGLKGLSVVGLPSYYKEKPSLNESSSYLLGFLSGWMASDGHVAKDGTIMLNSSKKENLEFAKLIALRLGIGTYGITCQKRLGINKKMSNLYRVHFVTEDLSARFFLIKEHRERYLNN
ncbi:MAG: hypothetical protein RLY43_1456, partial [Bacteroidota bacterium]